jgi:hypothetical protein
VNIEAEGPELGLQVVLADAVFGLDQMQRPAG